MTEITKAHWVRNLKANEELIINNEMQVEMAQAILELCKKKISEYPQDEIDVEKEMKKAQIPLGVD